MSNSRARSSIQSSLRKKGFMEKVGGDHWRYIFMTQDGKKTAVHTKISRGAKYRYLYDNMLSVMARQCGLLKSEFYDLIDCPLSKERYELILGEKELL